MARTTRGSLQNRSIRWADAAPEDFIFAVQGPRFLTHTLRLRRAAIGLANFFATGVLRLGHKLGPFLWQLPPPPRPARLTP